MQSLQVSILTGRALRQRQHTLDGAQYVNVCGNIDREGVYSEGECKFRVQIFLFIIKMN